MKNFHTRFLVFYTIVSLLTSCSNYEKSKNEVVIHELADADMLNPQNHTDVGATYILTNMFMGLTSIDFKTLEIIPVLAEKNAEIETTPEGKMLITYRIRPEARWDNGTPVTARDVEFTLKVIKNPKVNCQHIKPYYDFISDIRFYPNDSLKFTLICETIYIQAEASSGDFNGILPEYFYDPKGLMKNFSVTQLSTQAEKLPGDPKIIEFANDFNSEKRMREKDYISGCGPYKLTEWKTGEQIVLEKKNNWWGDQLKDVNMFFQANPKKIIYRTINDQTTALVSLKAGNIDVMRSIKSKDFAELPKSDKFNKNFNSYTPMMLAYAYIGLNNKKPQFNDKLTRQAMCHLLDVDKMIQTIKYGQAQRVIGPVHPSKAKEYNSDLVPYDYDLEKAKALLEKAGWKNTNGDETLDRIVDGAKIEFVVDFMINSGSDERKSVALLFQEEARKVGIKVNVVSLDWSVFLDRCKNHEFDMLVGGWVSTPLPNDFKQIYHSESAQNGGSNYVSYGTPESDALIDLIRVNLNEESRANMYKRFQAMLYEDAPYIYLWAPTERIAIHKRFTNTNISIMRPGYWEAGFQMTQ